jgi:hypothetical protein
MLLKKLDLLVAQAITLPILPARGHLEESAERRVILGQVCEQAILP